MKALNFAEPQCPEPKLVGPFPAKRAETMDPFYSSLLSRALAAFSRYQVRHGSENEQKDDQKGFSVPVSTGDWDQLTDAERETWLSSAVGWG